MNALLVDNQQQGAVLAALAFRAKTDPVWYTRIVKWISMFAVGAVIWMEFAVFGDITGSVLGYDFSGRAAVVWVVCTSVVYFTLRYGLRGMFLTDILHAPLIVGAGLILMLGAILALNDMPSSVELPKFAALGKPLLDNVTCILFFFHVMLMNSFLVVVSESHWLRLWMLGDSEVDQQPRSQAVTGLTWAVLIVIGLLASAIAGGKISTDAIATFLGKANSISPLFVMAFWIGGMASLFSTADCQVFCFRLVQKFNSRSGAISGNTVLVSRPFLVSCFASSLITGAYYIIRAQGIEFDKIVFSVIPLTLTLLPLIVALAFKRRPSLLLLLISFIGYLVIASIGLFVLPSENMKATLGAAFWPVLISLLQMLSQKYDDDSDENN